MVRSPAIFPHWAFRMLARVEIFSPKTLTSSRGRPWRSLYGSVCWGVVQRKYPSQSPCSELQARKPHLCVQDACGALCIDSLIKLWLTYSKLHIFKVKILSFNVCILQWNYHSGRVSEHNLSSKNLLVPFCNPPLSHLLSSGNHSSAFCHYRLNRIF